MDLHDWMRHVLNQAAGRPDELTDEERRHGQTDSWSKNFALKGPCSRFDLASAVMPLPERQRRGAVAGKRVRGLCSAPMSSSSRAVSPMWRLVRLDIQRG